MAQLDSGYVRIVHPSELLSEAIREAREHGHILQVNLEAKQTVIAPRLLRGFESLHQPFAARRR